MLTGQAKTDYQRAYMRRRRASQGLTCGGCKTSSSEPTRRFRILQRDNFRCQYCGRTAADDVRLEIDHVTPLCKGGTDTEDNLITACMGCNRSKGGKLLNYDAEQTIMSRTSGVLQGPESVRPKEIEPWPYIPVPDDYDLDEALRHPLPDFDADGNLIPEIE